VRAESHDAAMHVDAIQQVTQPIHDECAEELALVGQLGPSPYCVTC
jgi:hypothetical protein